MNYGGDINRDFFGKWNPISHYVFDLLQNSMQLVHAHFHTINIIFLILTYPIRYVLIIKYVLGEINDI